MPQELGDNGDWLKPKTVPQMNESQMTDAKARSAIWFGPHYKDRELKDALTLIDDAPIEIRQAVQTIAEVVLHRTSLVLDRESERRDREYARIFHQILSGSHPIDASLVHVKDAMGLNAKPGFENSFTAQVEHALRLKIISDLDVIKNALSTTEEINPA